MTTYNATVRRNANLIIGKGDGASLRQPGVRTIELGAVASGSIVDFKMQLPTATRLSAASRIYFDDFATSGSPTFNLGLYNVNGNTTDAPTALSSALAISSASAATGIIIPADYANAGKRLWELAGLSVDPGGLYAVKGQVKAAATNGSTLPATITVDLHTYDD